MTTSNSDPRCTRISPSAILDDRLDGHDLDWARDHLKRCETCRGRIEDFQEMVLRVERLPAATVSASAVEDAFVRVAPEVAAARSAARSARTFGQPPDEPVVASALAGLAAHAPGQEVASVPDLLSELERDIFKDDAWHSAPAAPPESPATDDQVSETAPPEAIESSPPAVIEPPAPEAVEPSPPDQASVRPRPPWLKPEIPDPAPALPPRPPWLKPEVPEPAPALPSYKEVEFDSRRPAPEPIPAPFWSPEEVGGTDLDESEPAPAAPPSRADTAMRIAVGLGAAACVLLAALLYESGWFGLGKKTSAVAPRPRPSVAASVTPTPAASVAPSPSATPSAQVVATLGNGVTGESVYRIRPGTAVAGYTRLVFDLRGTGFPTMIVTRPDDQHVVVTFKDTSGAGLGTGGIHSTQVAGLEPAVQQGPDLIITVDLARPVRVVTFTLPPSGSYRYRLVLDLYST